MNKAVEFAEEILRKKEALKNTKSNKLKRDYRKNIESSMDDLRFYCDCKKISIKEVFDKAVKLN